MQLGRCSVDIFRSNQSTATPRARSLVRWGQTQLPDVCDHLTSRPRLDRFDNFFCYRPSPWSKRPSFPAMSFQMVSLNSLPLARLSFIHHFSCTRSDFSALLIINWYCSVHSNILSPSSCFSYSLYLKISSFLSYLHARVSIYIRQSLKKLRNRGKLFGSTDGLTVTWVGEDIVRSPSLSTVHCTVTHRCSCPATWPHIECWRWGGGACVTITTTTTNFHHWFNF